MSFAARLLMALVGKIKALGFLEWAGIASLVDTVLTYNVKQELFRIVAEEMANRAGLNLNPEDPFSEASVSGAVSQRVGFPIRSLTNPQMIKEDVDNHLSQVISQKSGYQIRSVADQAVLRQDLMRIGAAQLSSDLGIPMGVVSEDGGGGYDPSAVKKRLLAWAKSELTANLNNEVRYGINDIVNTTDVQNFYAKLTKAETDADGNTQYPVTREQCAMLLAGGAGPNTQLEISALLASTIATKAVVEFQQMSREYGKDTRRREQNRAAQQKFRHIHGNRQKYIPVGMTAAIG